MNHNRRRNVEGYDEGSNSFKVVQLRVEELLLIEQNQPQVSTS